MNTRSILFALACLALGVALGVAAVQQGWLDWLYKNLLFVLLAIFAGAVVLAFAGLGAYFALKWWVRRKLGIEGGLSGEKIVTGLADKLTNREALDATDAQDRMHSLAVNLGLYYVRSVAMQRYLLIIGGTFTAVVGLATVFLLHEQNKKLDLQTRQIEIQSQANTVASLLMEGTRRAALAGEQTAVFEAIRESAAAIRKDDDGKADRECAKVEPGDDTAHLRACWRKVERPDKSTIELVHLPDALYQRVRAHALRDTPFPLGCGLK